MRREWLRFRFLSKSNIVMAENSETGGVKESQRSETARPVNKLGRVALWISIAAWVSFVLGVFLPYRASIASGIASVAIASVAFVSGLVSLRRSPRGASTAALVFSGVIVVMFVIVVIGIDMLKSIPAA